MCVVQRSAEACVSLTPGLGYGLTLHIKQRSDCSLASWFSCSWFQWVVELFDLSQPQGHTRSVCFKWFLHLETVSSGVTYICPQPLHEDSHKYRDRLYSRKSLQGKSRSERKINYGKIRNIPFKPFLRKRKHSSKRSLFLSLIAVPAQTAHCHCHLHRPVQPHSQFHYVCKRRGHLCVCFYIYRRNYSTAMILSSFYLLTFDQTKTTIWWVLLSSTQYSSATLQTGTLECLYCCWCICFKHQSATVVSD